MHTRARVCRTQNGKLKKKQYLGKINYSQEKLIILLIKTQS